jgi:asparagine synthase (glutamine-hydrolysing)
MSGLLGIWNSQQPAPWKQMLRDLDVLGPNGAGDWHGLNGRLSLGRTQFFDTPESCAEPPVIEYQGCVLVWEGRLDDRESLLSGHSQPVTDGQLLIESYRRWGIDCIDRLTGEFAFILWDASNDLLIVGCDPVGKHTLAYFWDGQTLILASRVLTLLLHPQVDQELDPLYLAHTLCSFYGQEAGSTAFKTIKRLQPGYALILKAGQFQEKQIASFIFADRYDMSRSPESYYDEFWDLLNKSVKDRLRTIHRPCTTLSGGLDSTTITVSLLNQLSRIDAFSNVTSIYPEFDEREPIKTFLQMYPQTQWHSVDADEAWSLSEPWERLPVTDDPLIPCTFPMGLNLMAHIQQQGFGLVFDGEWGDELFDISFADLLRTGRWRIIQEYLKREQDWPSLSLLWRKFVLPQLSASWQRQWLKWRNPITLPPWIKSNYAEAADTQRVIDQEYAAVFSRGLENNISWAMASGYATASSKAYSLMKVFHKLHFTSPLQDRRLIEFAINIPPELQTDSQHHKIFLRQANQGSLPAQIQWRPKSNYFDPLKYAGIAKGHQVLELLQDLKHIPMLTDIIDISQVEKILLSYRTGYDQNYIPGQLYRNSEANQIYELLAYVNWYQRIKDRLL